MNSKLLLCFLCCSIAHALFCPPATGQAIQILDPLAVRAEGDPSRAVLSISTPSRISRKHCDIVILGGGLGGSAAALQATSQGLHVCMTEPTHWIGGQLTSQGVSAFDDNQWTETSGSSRRFQQLRQAIRSHYAPFLREGLKADTAFNPGLCWVSYECSEPAVDQEVLQSMLALFIKGGSLTVLTRTAPYAVERNAGRLKSVFVYNFETHKILRLTGAVFIDATELGEFLPMAGAEYVTGAESQSQTGEPDAPTRADPNAAQSFTYTFVLGQSGMNPLDKQPTAYSNCASHFSFNSTDADNATLPYAMYAQLPNTPGSFWTYRRVIAKDQFKPGIFPTDLSMINWDGNDVCDTDLLSSDPAQQAKALQHGKQVSQAFVWWLQHDAPRDDKRGKGYPELEIVTSEMDSADGLSQFPYVREGRRLKALRVVHEQDLATKEARAVQFDDTVGIGQYPVDIHSCGPASKFPEAKPFQIPLGSLIPNNIDNLLAASKNIGTSHITNGAYRVHPTEWAIGTAAGATAAMAVKNHIAVKQIDTDAVQLRQLQRQLILSGQPLVWFDDVPVDSPHFQSAQLAAVLGLIALPKDSLSFHPEEAIEGREAVRALHKLYLDGKTHTVPDFAEDTLSSPVKWSRLGQFGSGAGSKSGNAKRAEFVEWIVSLYLTGTHAM
jgi:hypothetical protein